jgi:hypothetical protein
MNSQSSVERVCEDVIDYVAEQDLCFKVNRTEQSVEWIYHDDGQWIIQQSNRRENGHEQIGEEMLVTVVEMNMYQILPQSEMPD